MDNELTVRQGALVTLVSEKGIGDILKPLTREIHLLDTYIAGTLSLEDQMLPDAVQTGDKLQLQREENRFDEYAILVLDSRKQKLGYVPEKDSIVIARLMDAGKLLNAQVTGIGKKEGFRQISIGICLIDF